MAEQQSSSPMGWIFATLFFIAGSLGYYLYYEETLDVKKAQQSNQRLQSQNRELSSEVTDVSRQLSSIKFELQNNQLDQQQGEAELEAATDSVIGLRQEVRRLGDQLVAEAQKATNLTADADKFAAQQRESSELMEQGRKQLEEKQQELSDINETLALITASKLSLEENLSKLMAEKSNFDQQLLGQNDKVTQAVTEMEKQAVLLAKAQQQVSSLQTQIANTGQLGEQAKSTEQILKLSQQDNAKLQAQVQELLQSKDITNTSQLDEQLKSSQQDNAKLQAQVKKLLQSKGITNTGQLDEQLKSSQQDNAKLQAQVQKLQQKNIELTNELNHMSDELEKIRKQQVSKAAPPAPDVEEKDTELIEANREFALALKKSEELVLHSQRQDAEISDLQDTLADQKKQMKILKEKADTANSIGLAIDDVTDQNQQLTSRLLQAGASIADLNRQVKENKQEISSVRQELEIKQEQVKEEKQKLTDLALAKQEIEASLNQQNMDLQTLQAAHGELNEDKKKLIAQVSTLDAATTQQSVNNQQLSDKNIQLLTELEELQGSALTKDKELTSLASQLAVNKQQHQAAQGQAVKLTEQLQQVSQQKNQLVSRLSTKTEALKLTLTDLEQALLKQQQLKLALNTSIEEKQRLAQVVKGLLEEQEKQTIARQALQQQLDKLSQQNQILLTRSKDGKTVIRLQSRVLFKSGSADISYKGQKALEAVAGLLKDYQGYRIRVEGHTDGKGIGDNLNSLYPTNWELSSARSVTAVRVLSYFGVDPEKLEAVARAHYMPLSQEPSVQARQQNRRIDIYLHPQAEVVINDL